MPQIGFIQKVIIDIDSYSPPTPTPTPTQTPTPTIAHSFNTQIIVNTSNSPTRNPISHYNYNGIAFVKELIERYCLHAKYLPSYEYFMITILTLNGIDAGKATLPL